MKYSAMPSRTLCESTYRRLNMYALAAGAAGVGMLALSQPGEAKIIYRSAHKHIGINSTVPFDIDRDGTTDFTFTDRTSASWPPHGTLSIIPAGANQVWGHDVFGRGYASALVAGVRVGNGRHFFPGKERMAKTSATYYSCQGPWGWAKGRYLGLRFAINGKPHFGWARLNVSCKDFNVTATLTGYAYETVPGKPIVTGTKVASDETVADGPLPISSSHDDFKTSLGHLALGATVRAMPRAN